MPTPPYLATARPTVRFNAESGSRADTIHCPTRASLCSRFDPFAHIGSHHQYSLRGVATCLLV